MQPLTGYERISNILKRQPVDHIGVFEHFWDDTRGAWEKNGWIKPGESFEDHFGYDLQLLWPFDVTADLDAKLEVIEETEETITTRNGNRATLRNHKLHSSTPEHIDFWVKDRQGWEDFAKPLLTPERRRIKFKEYRQAKADAAKKGRFFCWSGVNVFEIMKDITGHLNMLVGMKQDPAWVCDMVETYTDLTIHLQEMLFAEEGYPDGIWYYEDMGFKQHPFISPQLYREILMPGHKRSFDWAHSRALPVIVHSCGYVEPLLPGLLEAGIDCLQVIEVKAGMDLLKLYEEYGDRLSFMGGIDVRVLYNNDPHEIDRELEAKIPVVKGQYGYVLHSDHSIPWNVHHDVYRYFIDKGIELGTYSN
jgi:uroporphyrinogen decarboxylase